MKEIQSGVRKLNLNFKSITVKLWKKQSAYGAENHPYDDVCCEMIGILRLGKRNVVKACESSSAAVNDISCGRVKCHVLKHLCLGLINSDKQTAI